MEMAKERDEGMKILQKGEYQYDSNTSETSVRCSYAICSTETTPTDTEELKRRSSGSIVAFVGLALDAESFNLICGFILEPSGRYNWSSLMDQIQTYGVTQ